MLFITVSSIRGTSSGYHTQHTTADALPPNFPAAPPLTGKGAL